MSNPNMEVPEHLRSGPLADAAQKALQDAASMASSSNSVPRISLRGREFRFVEGGEEVKKMRDHMDVIILGVEPGQGNMIKTFYAKGYTSGAKEPPTCASDDGIAPSPWVQEKQAQQCRTCAKNQFGSATSPSGKATKACRDSKRIWVVRADDEVKDVPISERTMYGLNVTVASLKAFSEHGRLLTSLGQGPAVCVTRVVMLDMEYPQVEFKLHAWLDAATAPQTLKIADARPWKVFNSSTLALAMNGGDGDQTRAQLPMTAGAVPDHLKQTAAAPAANVVDATPAGAKPIVDASKIDEELGKW